MTELKERYNTQIRPQLATELGLQNIHQIPVLKKVAINVGLGDLKGNEPLQKAVEEALGIITGQKPVKTRAKRAIAGFKLRANDVIWYKVTLRGPRMYDFLDRLITYVLPRLRDFQGVPLKGFDGRGSYTFGLREHSVFPELPFQANERPWSLEITIVTTANDKQSTQALLTHVGLPFAKGSKK